MSTLDHLIKRVMGLPLDSVAGKCLDSTKGGVLVFRGVFYFVEIADGRGHLNAGQHLKEKCCGEEGQLCIKIDGVLVWIPNIVKAWNSRKSINLSLSGLVEPDYGCGNPYITNAFIQPLGFIWLNFTQGRAYYHIWSILCVRD